jgi:1-acyl-sn-glycerol-3-phosphate acyltransferase
LLRLSCKIYLRLGHWKAVGIFPPSLKKAVVIVAPHTSSADVIVCLAFRKVLHLERFKFIGKQELFKSPFGFIFRKLGGMPVDRFHKQGFIDQVADMFNNKEEFIIGLSPEGTRKRVDRLRTGFYHIAKKAGVPIVMLGLDFENRQLVFAEPFLTGNDEQADFDRILRFFGPIKGKHPELGLTHLTGFPCPDK